MSTFTMPFEPLTPHTVPDDHPLASAWAKHTRALEHQRHLGEAVPEFANKRGALRVEGAGEGRFHFFADLDSVPLRLSCLLGDVVHNARAALDHAQWALAMANGFTRKPKSVYFPMYNDAVEFAAKGRPVLLEHVGAPATDLLEQFQPYQERRQGLKWLHALDIVDKHRAVILVAQTLRVDEMFVKDSNGERPFDRFGEAPGGFRPIVPGEPLFSLKLVGKAVADVHISARLSTNLAFPPESECGAERLDLVLHQVLFDTEECLLAIQGLFDGDRVDGD